MTLLAPGLTGEPGKFVNFYAAIRVRAASFLNPEKIIMRSLIQKFTTAAILLTAAVTTVSESQAAKIRLDGFGYYANRGKVNYYSNPAPKQGGRYSNLGADYYHKISYTMDFVTNRSGRRSGSLSYEFWAMPYYQASTGIVVMTRGLKRMKGYQSVSDLRRTGLAVDLDSKRFPEINIWEYTRKGWKFRDALSFTYKDWL